MEYEKKLTNLPGQQFLSRCFSVSWRNYFFFVFPYDPIGQKLNKTKGTLVHERGKRLLEGVEAIT